MTAVEVSLTGAYTGKLFDALEDGSIETRPFCPPPSTGDEVLDAAGSPSATWWQDYRRSDESIHRLPAAWADWFRHGGMELNAANLLSFIGETFQAEQRAVAASGVSRLSTDVWSDLEVLAWIASRDSDFVASVRHLGIAIGDRRETGRTMGFNYLRFEVSRRFCTCGGRAGHLGFGEPDACICLSVAWKQLVKALASGELTATCAGDDGTQRIVEAASFRGAILDMKQSEFSLIGGDSQLLFDSNKVRALHMPIVRHTLDELRAWIDEQPMMAADTAFTIYKGLNNCVNIKQPEFRKEWGKIKDTIRGRPKNSQR